MYLEQSVAGQQAARSGSLAVVDAFAVNALPAQPWGRYARAPANSEAGHMNEMRDRIGGAIAEAMFPALVRPHEDVRFSLTEEQRERVTAAARAAIRALRDPTDDVRHSLWYEIYREVGAEPDVANDLARKRVEDPLVAEQDRRAFRAFVIAALR